MPLTHAQVHIDELCDPERILHIDSKVLDKAEAEEEPVETAEPAEAEAEAEEAEAPTERKLTKAGTGRAAAPDGGHGRAAPGQPGASIQNVISVGMLTEGWDAKTVTHIMGLRAFTSQLLCEQVVGRGLRRTSYEVDPETGLVRAGVRQHLRRAVYLPAARRRAGRPAAAAHRPRLPSSPIPAKASMRFAGRTSCASTTSSARR